MESNNNLWEYKESINRLQATPQEVEKVWKDIEYSNRLIKAHNVMKVLELPDSQDNPIRQMLLKQDDKTLEGLAKKSQDEIKEFLLNAKENHVSNIDTENNEKLNRLQSAFPKSVLDKNQDIATMLEKKDFDKLLATLKDPKRLKSITDQLWWADKNNPQYLEFKNALIWVDSGFEQYFSDLEKINSKSNLSADEIVKWIGKDSGGMIDIDLKSNPPLSKMSLIWSQYSFDEEIDKKALDKITAESKEKLDEIQSSIATLKGLYKPFDSLVTLAKKSWWHESFKEQMREGMSAFPKSIFWELNDMYKNYKIESEMQISEADFTSFADVGSEDELRAKITKIEEKFEKIKRKIQEIHSWIIDEHQGKIKELLSKNSQDKERQLEVLNFMKDCGFDLIPKEISDSAIKEIQAGTLTIAWLELNRKNIDLKKWNFWEDAMHEGEGLNTASKTNMVKFVNKMISWNTNEPLWVESIVDGTFKADPSFLQNKFLESWVVDAVGWRQGKVSENLEKAMSENKAS